MVEPTIPLQSSPLPVINEELNTNNVNTQPHHPELSTSILQELSIDTTSHSSPKLSQNQILEITKAITKHLQKHGKITMELINFIKDGFLVRT
jgi:hypothetical protein